MKTARATVLAACLFFGAVASAAADPSSKPKTDGAPMAAPQSLFVSGHSLTNEPLQSDIAAIAAGFGMPLTWNRQHLEGSTIEARSAEGSKGVDRANQPVDVFSEIARPAQHPERPYDVLLITEQHSILGSLVWNKTASHLRTFHNRFVASNPNGVTFFFEPWLSLDDKSKPARWIAYERAASPVWRCVVAELNLADQAGGGRDRLRSIPAALALAKLVELATRDGGLSGITQPTVRATVDSLFSDDVHLTRLGSYYISLVVFAYTFEHSPLGAWHPADVSQEQAKALQETAAAFVAETPAAALPLAECRDYVLQSFLGTYLSYAEAVQWRRDKGRVGALYLRAKLAVQWPRLFASDTADNPFSASAYRPN